MAYSKVIKTAANVIDSHLANIIKSDLKDKQFLKKLKDRNRKIKNKIKIKNYRPVKLLNGFCKVYERLFDNRLTNFTDKIISQFIST